MGRLVALSLLVVGRMRRSGRVLREGRGAASVNSRAALAKLPVIRKEGYTGMLRSEFPLRPEDNRVWSKEELVKIFRDDLVSFERGVLRLAPNLAGRQGAFDACVAFSFNVGLGNFQRSTIRMKIGREEWEGAAEAFMSWTKAGGKELRGLVLRRTAERQLFETSIEKET